MIFQPKYVRFVLSPTVGRRAALSKRRHDGDGCRIAGTTVAMSAFPQQWRGITIA
jgi:hypothetical protein